MALTLIVEDGTGLSTANVFCSLAEAATFHAGRVYRETWESMTQDQQKAALVNAALLLSTLPVWQGVRTTKDQALAFPRIGLIDRDGYEIDSDSVPVWLKNANAELARALQDENREAEPDSKNLSSLSVGSIAITFDKNDQKNVLPDSVLSFIGPYCSVQPRGGSTSVRTLRV